MNTRAMQRLSAHFRQIAQAMDELIEEDNWIDQESSPLGRRTHCKAARSGALPARKLAGKWLARRKDIDAYIEAHGTKPPAERTEENEDRAVAEILEFRAPRRRRAGKASE